MANLHPAHPGVWFDHAANALKHRDEPRLRASMPAIVYEHLAYWTCSEPVKMLWRINVFRKGVENNVDIWANDKAMALSKMITLLQRADSFNAMWVSNMFGVSGNGNVLMTFKFDRGISVERMHAVVASWYGSTNFNLFHLGFEISDGLLVDHGVEPGSLLEFRRAPAFLLLPSDDPGFVIQVIKNHFDNNRSTEAADAMRGWVWFLASRKDGCQLVQKVMRNVELVDLGHLVSELHGRVLQGCRCPHANFVLQCAIQASPAYLVSFMSTELAPFVQKMARHKFGCRIIMCMLEHGSGGVIPEAVNVYAKELSHDRYGSYVVQCLLEHGTVEQQSSVVFALGSQNVQLALEAACHKSASYVVQCALKSSAPGSADLKHTLSTCVRILAYDVWGSRVLKTMM
jgi:hypothetical protein